MRRAPREEEAISVYAADGSLLAHYEERYSRICEEMPQSQVQANLIHTHPQSLHSMVTP